MQSKLDNHIKTVAEMQIKLNNHEKEIKALKSGEQSLSEQPKSLSTEPKENAITTLNALLPRPHGADPNTTTNAEPSSNNVAIAGATAHCNQLQQNQNAQIARESPTPQSEPNSSDAEENATKATPIETGTNPIMLGLQPENKVDM